MNHAHAYTLHHPEPQGEPMKVHKIEMLVIDFDDVGAEDIKSIIENARYPNHCISPDVKKITTVETKWSDDHPLNHHDTADKAYRAMFA
jgi:hypothetical protein